MERITMLLVEEGEALALMARKALQSHGIADGMVWCKSADLAAHMLFSTEPDMMRTAARLRLMLLDGGLPREGAYDLLRRVRRHPATAFLPVVISVEADDAAGTQRAYSLGANSVLHRSGDESEFVRAIAEAGSYWTRANRAIHAVEAI